jgi:hypothetical protein
MEDFEKMNLERQKKLAPIHEAGHVIAARYLGLEVVSVDVKTRGEQCGLTTVKPMSAEYDRHTNLPLDKEEALIGFNRHNFELLAGPAAQAIYCYDNEVRTLNGFMPIQPEIWGILLEFSNDDRFFDFDGKRLSHGMGFFLVENGASGDWKKLLSHFKALPYNHFELTSTPENRVDYLRQYWAEVVAVLRERWDDVVSIAEALKWEESLNGKRIESILLKSS